MHEWLVKEAQEKIVWKKLQFKNRTKDKYDWEND